MQDRRVSIDDDDYDDEHLSHEWQVKSNFALQNHCEPRFYDTNPYAFCFLSTY